MPLESSPAKLLAAVRELLNKWSTGWYVFGAQAVMVWGRPRLTADVDITARLNPDDLPGFREDMRRAGFELRVPDVESFLARTRVLPFLHLPTQMPLDIVLAGSGIEDIFLQRARTVEIEGMPMSVASPEDLIVMKLLAGRPKDMEDVRSVLAERHSTLDLAHIHSMLDLLEQALGQSDLLPAFEAEVHRVDRGRQ